MTIEINDSIEDMPIFPCAGPIVDPLKADLSDAEIIKAQALELKPDGLDSSNMCSEDQILTRYKQCGECDFFDHNTCTKCGCILVSNKIYMSKLAWKTEQCPIGKWGPISD